MPSISGPDFITLLVDNLAASHDFYKNTLGLPESPENRPNVHAFSTKPCGLAIRQSAEPHTARGSIEGIIVSEWVRLDCPR